jgi:hypothetical protein
MRARVIVAAFTTAIGCAGFAGPADAQTLAVTVGTNTSNMTQNATFRPDDVLNDSDGFMVGAQIRRAVNRVFQLQIEGLFTQKGNVLRNDADDLYNTIVVNYIEVPVLARFGVMQRGQNAVSVHGGPTLAFNAGTRETNNGHGVARPLKLKTFDIGIAIGGQFERKRLILGARYTAGLLNIFGDDPDVFGFSAMKSKAFTLFAGCRLR